MPRQRQRRRPGAAILVAATGASLIVTIAGGYMTRLSLIEASWWVTHTDEVKLAVDRCELALLEGEDTALKRAQGDVERLTVDNPRQQQNVARAALLSERGEQGPLRDLFRSMQNEEDRLMVERLARISRARTRSSLAFVIGALLTVLFAAAAVSVLRKQRQDLARQRGLLEAVIESVDEGIVAVDASRNTVAMNAVARAMIGRSFPRDHLPDDWREHISAVREDGSEIAPQDAPLARAVRGDASDGVVYRIVSTDHLTPGVWVSTTARPIRDAAGQVVAAVATLRDITEERARAERLHDLSLKDELTGLLNRRGFVTLANARIASLRAAKAPVAVLYADLNGLKRVNDELGHEEGDRAIRDAAEVLRGIFRERDILARIGGDEFVAFLPNFQPTASDALLARLAAAVRSYGEREQRPYRLSISAGVTLMDWESGKSLDELLADADRLMYARKREHAGTSSGNLRAIPSPSGKRQT